MIDEIKIKLIRERLEQHNWDIDEAFVAVLLELHQLEVDYKYFKTSVRNAMFNINSL